jgi:hypothetical protein
VGLGLDRAPQGLSQGQGCIGRPEFLQGTQQEVKFFDGQIKNMTSLELLNALGFGNSYGLSGLSVVLITVGGFV